MANSFHRELMTTALAFATQAAHALGLQVSSATGFFLPKNTQTGPLLSARGAARFGANLEGTMLAMARSALAALTSWAAVLPRAPVLGLSVAALLLLASPARAQTCPGTAILAEPGLCLEGVGGYLLTPTVLDYGGPSPVITISSQQWSRDLLGSGIVNFVADTTLFAPAGGQRLTFGRESGNPAIRVAINNTGAMGLLAQSWVHNQVAFTNASGATITIDPAFTSGILSQSSSFLNQGTFLLTTGATPPANAFFTIGTSGAPPAAPVFDNRGLMIAERGAQGVFEQATTHQNAQVEARDQGQFVFSGASFFGDVTTRTDQNGSAITLRNHTATGDWTHAAGRLELEDVTFTRSGSRFMNVSADPLLPALVTIYGPMRGDVAIQNTGVMTVLGTGGIGPSGTGPGTGPAPTIVNEGSFGIEPGATVEVSQFLNQNGGNTLNRGVLTRPRPLNWRNYPRRRCLCRLDDPRRGCRASHWKQSGQCDCRGRPDLVVEFDSRAGGRVRPWRRSRIRPVIGARHQLRVRRWYPIGGERDGAGRTVLVDARHLFDGLRLFRCRDRHHWKWRCRIFPDGSDLRRRRRSRAEYLGVDAGSLVVPWDDARQAADG